MRSLLQPRKLLTQHGDAHGVAACQLAELLPQPRKFGVRLSPVGGHSPGGVGAVMVKAKFQAWVLKLGHSDYMIVNVID